MHNDAQGVGLAAGELWLIRSGLLQRHHIGHLPGQEQTPPQLRLQGNEYAVAGGVEVQIAIGADEVEPFNHMQNEVLDRLGGVDQVLAVEDIFAAGFLAQVGNQFHDPLVILK